MTFVDAPEKDNSIEAHSEHVKTTFEKTLLEDPSS